MIVSKLFEHLKINNKILKELHGDPLQSRSPLTFLAAENGTGGLISINEDKLMFKPQKDQSYNTIREKYDELVKQSRTSRLILSKDKPHGFWSYVVPAFQVEPTLLSFNSECASDELGLDGKYINEKINEYKSYLQSQRKGESMDSELSDDRSNRECVIFVNDLTDLLCGNKVLEVKDSSTEQVGERATFPWAHNYGGHQFGFWAGQLGDGRATSLFQVEKPQKMTLESKKTPQDAYDIVEVQLKGSGKTPYSRMGDGCAVMRSSIREYLVAENLHSLGVPTTRSLSLVLSSNDVYRESDEPEHGAVVCRVSPSFIRFGSFELARVIDDKNKNTDGVRELADYVIRTHYPYLLNKDESNNVETNEPDFMKSNVYARLLQTIVSSTAKLVAKWQSLGFCHGVLNTDNMSVLGLTLDYGPFAFMDIYDPEYICNSSDESGRYSYKQQPGIVLWNLMRLTDSLYDLIESVNPPENTKTIEVVTNILNTYGKIYNDEYQMIMVKKMGFFTELTGLYGGTSETGEAGEAGECTESSEVDGVQKKQGNTANGEKVLVKERIKDIYETVVTPYLSLMRDQKMDFTNSFRNLSKIVALKYRDGSGNRLFGVDTNDDGLQDKQQLKHLRNNLEEMIIRYFLYNNEQKPESTQEDIQQELKSRCKAVLDYFEGIYFVQLEKFYSSCTPTNNGHQSTAGKVNAIVGKLDKTNPQYVLRNWIAEYIISNTNKLIDENKDGVNSNYVDKGVLIDEALTLLTKHAYDNCDEVYQKRKGDNTTDQESRLFPNSLRYSSVSATIFSGSLEKQEQTDLASKYGGLNSKCSCSSWTTL
ncbi:UPF0061 protein [Zancudomyces culisetae]|uniref:Selenoprotein O n=1 Tax=Zancudomyces culisetae TaxID=1213189 RepID=A0A1R1PEN4_ZANCU|nr:UPF0061 protein [Zancudomyces culisetae]|eukprot:OMH79421.1 UPF0061 protein [Zancudomyces culisetae]